MQTQRGFTYLGVLFFVAITSAALAALGQAWSTAAQRERERELAFRGGEIARAIASYVKASSDGIARYPRRLEDLLEDRRGPKTAHHLRRLYLDPFTGQADWVLLPEPSQPETFNGVHSRADRALLREVLPDGTRIDNAREWHFLGRAYQRRQGEAVGPTDVPSPLPVVPVVPLPVPEPSGPVPGVSQARQERGHDAFELSS